MNYSIIEDNCKEVIPEKASIAGDPAGCLVDTTNTASAPRTKYYKTLDNLKDFIVKSGLNLRVNTCMTTVQGEVLVRETENQKAYYRNIIRCGAIWQCPICSYRIKQQRRSEIERAINKNPDLYTVMITATLQHSRKDELLPLFNALNESMRSLKSGRYWKRIKEKYSIRAHITSREITYSLRSGWHPHQHILIFMDKKPNIEELKEEITRKYTEKVAKAGRYASKYHSIDIREGDENAAAYIQKWQLSEEMTMGNLKTSDKSYTPFELAEHAKESPILGRLFIEYITATHGKRQTTWSRKGREALGLDEEMTLEELAENEIGAKDTDKTICEISREDWNNKVLKNCLQGKILELAESGGAKAIKDYLDSIET